MTRLVDKMDFGQFDVISATEGDASKAGTKKVGHGAVIRAGVGVALATIALVGAVACNKPQVQDGTSDSPAAVSTDTGKGEGKKDASKTTDASKEDEGKTTDASKATAKEPGKVDERINLTAEAEAAKESTQSINSTPTPTVQVVTVPVQQQEQKKDEQDEAAKEPVWVEEQGHWEYVTVTDYEERTVYRDEPRYVEKFVYVCSDGDFVTEDVDAAIAHGDAHGTTMITETQQIQDGYEQVPDGTEMVPVGTHQELGEWIVDVPGHWE